MSNLMTTPEQSDAIGARLDRRGMLRLCVMAATAYGLGAGGYQLTQAMAQESTSALSAAQHKLVAAIADTILPDTDTPGALKAGVPDFIDLMVTFWLDDADRASFQSGLDDFAQQTIRAQGTSFDMLLPAQRLNWLKTVQADAWSKRGAGIAPPFFLWIKRLTVFGYYTSEVGATEELTYNLVPGEYQPCAHLGTDHAFSINRSGFVFPVGNAPATL
jgi:hypothetical protein